MHSVKDRAPYATTAIPLFLTSLTGHKYRTLQCIECGSQFIERNDDTLWRLNDTSQPAQVTINGTDLSFTCGSCTQQYIIVMSLAVEKATVSLHEHPESLYLSPEPNKSLRDIHCMECGYTFYTISDRISKVVDNRIPMRYVDPNRIGPTQAICNQRPCRQTWAIMV